MPWDIKSGGMPFAQPAGNKACTGGLITNEAMIRICERTSYCATLASWQSYVLSFGVYSSSSQALFADLMDWEDLSSEPSGGSVQRWLLGVGVAAGIIAYAIVCIHRGYTAMFFDRGYWKNDYTYNAGYELAIS